MDKEKEIRDIAKTICCHSFKAKSENEECDCPYYSKEYNSCDNRHIALDGSARRLYNAGYRKADEVRKETAKEIFIDLWRIFKTDSCASVIKEYAEIYGVEVDE